MKRSSSTFRVDEQVYITMGIIGIIALVTLAFRFATSHPCSPIAIQINANAFVEGNVITFKAATQGGSTFAWNFGDNNTVEEQNPSTTHIYKNAGKYTVSVTVNGQCTEVQNVVITEAAVIANNSLQLFVGPDTAYVNEPVSYEDQSLNSTSWEWYFEDGNTVDAKTRKALHTYTTGGPKKILLKVNGKADLVVGRLIYVIDKQAQKNAAREAAIKHDAPKPKVNNVIILPANPTAPPLTNPTVEEKKPEEKPKVPTVTDQQLETMIRGVIDGSKTASDFSAYLCNNLTMSVTYNSDKTTFSAMCESLKEYKKKKLKKVTVSTVKDATNCILYMHVTVEKKGFLGL